MPFLTPRACRPEANLLAASPSSPHVKALPMKSIPVAFGRWATVLSKLSMTVLFGMFMSHFGWSGYVASHGCSFFMGL